jgi:hypothetical protein
MNSRLCWLLAVCLLLSSLAVVTAQKGKKGKTPTFPPRLPGGKNVVTVKSAALLEAPPGLAKDVRVAKTTPTVDFLYFPGQDYPGKPWSAWGESLFAAGKYYASIGDHLAPAGNAFVHEYDPEKKTFRRLLDVRKLLGLPEGHYTPGKIHSRLDLGSDGFLYFATHRGSTRVTTDAYHYKGDWIIRHHPGKGLTEVLAHGPVPKHCIPASVLDPTRLIFYGATAPGQGETPGKFFAFDVKRRKVLQVADDGPKRALLLARSTGRLYYTRASDDRLMRYDPATNAAPVALEGTIGIRAATAETAAGKVYAVSQGGKAGRSTVYEFDVKTEKVRVVGPAAVGSQEYVAALVADSAGRHLYYAPGAHGGADRDGTPIVQMDTRNGARKVLAFLAKPLAAATGCTPKGTYSLALDEHGGRLFITWNASRGTRSWDCCALTIVHIPESERKP